MMSDDIFPVPLQSRGGSRRAETRPGVHVELLEESVELQDVIVQAFEVILIGLIVLALPCFDGRFGSVLGLGDLKREGPELDRYPGGLVALGGIVRAPNGVSAQRTMPTKSRVVDSSTSLFRWYITIELDAGCTTRSTIRGLVRVINFQFEILFQRFGGSRRLSHAKSSNFKGVQECMRLNTRTCGLIMYGRGSGGTER